MLPIRYVIDYNVKKYQYIACTLQTNGMQKWKTFSFLRRDHQQRNSREMMNRMRDVVIMKQRKEDVIFFSGPWQTGWHII